MKMTCLQDQYAARRASIYVTRGSGIPFLPEDGITRPRRVL